MRGLACVALAWPVSAITGHGKKIMAKKNNADAIDMPLCSVCRVQLTEDDKLAEQQVFKNGRLQYIKLHHQKCSTDCMYLSLIHI